MCIRDSDKEALRVEAEQQVSIRADVGPDVPEAVMTCIKEGAALGQQAGDHLQVQVWGPAAVLVPVALTAATKSGLSQALISPFRATYLACGALA